jgi:hypothetical protein
VRACVRNCSLCVCVREIESGMCDCTSKAAKTRSIDKECEREREREKREKDTVKEERERGPV